MPSRYPHLTFCAQDLDIPVLIQALKDYGCIFLRGLFPWETMSALRPRAEAAFDRWDAGLAQGTLPEAYRLYYRYNHLPIAELNDPGAHSLQMFQLLLASPLVEILQAYFHGHFQLSIPHAVIRRQLPLYPQWFTQFHQDGYFCDPAWTVLHCWAPLMPCGEEAPSLAVIPAGLKAIRPAAHKPFRGEHFYDNKDLDYASDILPFFPEDTHWPLVFEPGDAVLYDNFALHSTYFQPGMTQQRVNIEYRAIPDVVLPKEIRQAFKMIRV